MKYNVQIGTIIGVGLRLRALLLPPLPLSSLLSTQLKLSSRVKLETFGFTWEAGSESTLVFVSLSMIAL